MPTKFCLIKNENGAALVAAMVFLMLLTIIGIFSTRTSTTELQISGNDKLNKIVFYAADSGIDYVAVHPDLYGSKNITAGTPVTFPDPSDTNATYALSGNLRVNGTVAYIGKTQMPAGSGYSAGIFFAVNYDIRSRGAGPNHSQETIEAGCYRIGL